MSWIGDVWNRVHILTSNQFMFWGVEVGRGDINYIHRKHEQEQRSFINSLSQSIHSSQRQAQTKKVVILEKTSDSVDSYIKRVLRWWMFRICFMDLRLPGFSHAFVWGIHGSFISLHRMLRLSNLLHNIYSKWLFADAPVARFGLI